jgi:hypothetical protein
MLFFCLLFDRWIKKHLGSVMGIDIDAMKKENEDLKAANTELSKKVEELSKKVYLIYFISC